MESARLKIMPFARSEEEVTVMPELVRLTVTCSPKQGVDHTVQVATRLCALGLFRRVPPSARIAQEEILGPVLSVIPFHSIPFQDEAEAIPIANGTVYGLATCVWNAGSA